MKASAFDSKERPRTCIISMRGIKQIAGRGTAYEFEDVIRGVERADLIEPSPGAGFRSREWVVSRLSWRPILREVGSRLNPGLAPVALNQEYELMGVHLHAPVGPDLSQCGGRLERSM